MSGARTTAAVDGARVTVVHGPRIDRQRCSDLIIEVAARTMHMARERLEVQRDVRGCPRLLVDGAAVVNVSVSASRAASRWAVAVAEGCRAIGLDIVDERQARDCGQSAPSWALLEASSKLHGCGIMHAAIVPAAPWWRCMQLAPGITAAIAAMSPVELRVLADHAAR